MGYLDVSLNVTAMSLGTVPEHKRRRPKAIVVTDFGSTDDQKLIIFHDVFTPDASNGVAAPTAITRTWFKCMSGGNKTTVSFGKNELEGIELFGAVDVSSNISDNSGNIHVAWEDV